MFRRIGPTFLALLLVRGFAVLGPLVLMPFLVKTIGLSGWGMISFATAATSFGGALVQYGFSVSATAEIARTRESRPKLARMWQANFAASLWLAVFVLVTGLLAIIIVEERDDLRLLLAGALVMAIATSLVPVWLFMGLERMKGVIISSGWNRLGYLLLVLLLIRSPAQTQWVTVIGAAAATAGLLSSLVEVKRGFGLSIPLMAPPANVRAALHQGFPVFLMMALPLLYNAGGVFLLGLTVSKVEVGLFSVAFTIIESAIIGGRLLTNAGLAIVASEKDRHAHFARFTMAVGIIAAVLMIAIAPLVARWLTPQYTLEATIVMALLALSIPFAFAQLVFGQNYLAIHGQPGIASKIVIYSSLFGAVMVLLFVPWLGAIGLAGVMLACRILLGSGSLFAYRRLRCIEASVPEQSNWWVNSAQ
jgi:O-antigen/teichoic acid export membrane protein